MERAANKEALGRGPVDQGTQSGGVRLLRYAVIVGLAAVSPAMAMTYAGLTSNRLVRRATCFAAAAAVAACEITALGVKPSDGPAMTRHYGFLMAQAITLNVGFSILAGATMTRMRMPRAGQTTWRANLLLAGCTAALICAAQYGPFAYRAETARDAAQVVRAKKTLLAAARRLEASPPAEGMTAQRRASMLAFDAAIKEQPEPQLQSDEAFNAYLRERERCSAELDDPPLDCLLMGKPRPRPRPPEAERWQALGEMLSPTSLLTRPAKPDPPKPD